MSDKFNPIPEGTVGLELRKCGCGNECCCNWMEIRAKVANHPQARGEFYYPQLWESRWWNTDDWPVNYDSNELADEAEAACRHYGWEVKLDRSEPYAFWDWEAEKCLSSGSS